MGLAEVPTIPDFGRITAGLGQALFGPPNVAGWAGGRTWITPSTLLERGNLFRGVLFPDDRKHETGVQVNVDAADPLVYVKLSVILLLVAEGASWFPARRATRIDPVIALRTSDRRRPSRQPAAAAAWA